MTERYTDGFEDVGTNIKRPRRILIDDELDAIDAVDALKAPIASPTFTGTVGGVVLGHGTGTEAANAVTINAASGTITTSALTTALDGTVKINFVIV